MNLGLEDESEEEDVIPYDLHENVHVVTQRPRRTKIFPARLEDCDVITCNKVTEDGDLIHFSLLADAKPINHNETLKSEAWNNVMVEELTTI